MKYLILYLAVINVISFIAAFSDKILAVKHKYRISEKTLFILAFIGGAPLMYASMRIFHHKTLHKRFMIGLPLITAFQVIFLYIVKIIAES